MSATVTAWACTFIDSATHERLYVGSGEVAASVSYIDGHTIGGVERPWHMTAFRDGETTPRAWWYYATLDEAIAGADDELSAIVPGLERHCACGDALTPSERTRCTRCVEGER